MDCFNYKVWKNELNSFNDAVRKEKDFIYLRMQMKAEVEDRLRRRHRKE